MIGEFLAEEIQDHLDIAGGHVSAPLGDLQDGRANVAFAHVVVGKKVERIAQNPPRRGRGPVASPALQLLAHHDRTFRVAGTGRRP